MDVLAGLQVPLPHPSLLILLRFRRLKACIFHHPFLLRVPQGFLSDKLDENWRFPVHPVFARSSLVFRRAFAELKVDDLSELLQGVSGISYDVQDGVAICKTLASFKKQHENFKILGGRLEGKPMTVGEIEELALLPSREVLLAKAVGAIKFPITGTVFVLSGILRKFLYAF